MLQKQSKKHAKWKYLFLIPLIAGILTYVGCTDDNGVAENKMVLTLEEQIQDLKTTLDTKEEITESELNSLKELEVQYKAKAESITGVEEVVMVEEQPIATKEEVIMVTEVNTNEQEITDVPFAVIDEVPTFPGCESYGQKAKKECMSNLVNEFVSKNFNTALGKELGLTGIKRVYVRFKIDDQGNVVNVESRGPHPKLEEEAVRVVSKLPKMQPGKQRGKAVGTLYALPITFQAN